MEGCTIARSEQLLQNPGNYNYVDGLVRTGEFSLFLQPGAITNAGYLIVLLQLPCLPMLNSAFKLIT